jgi:hypothetical protein
MLFQQILATAASMPTSHLYIEKGGLAFDEEHRVRHEHNVHHTYTKQFQFH